MSRVSVPGTGAVQPRTRASVGRQRAGALGAGAFAFLTVAAGAVTPATLLSQSPGPLSDSGAEAPRPKIGLVLGGGGAKGGAHVGVLEVLEELRIPVDFIAGTSIGAAIGGLYASGMSVPDLKALLESLDWQDLLSDQPPRRYQPFRLKSTDRRIPARLEVGFNGGKFRLPTGIVTGQNVELTLRSATLPVAHIRSFERLPTPFVAVATDLVTGEMVVLDRGDLSRAMRASMSIPGAFSPVEVDGLVLVDGGLVRNLPVDVVRAMGADVVIAVDLTPPLYDAEELESAIEVSMQTFRISTLQNTVPQREALVAGRDVLLRPDVADVPITDFRSLTGAFAAGAEVARAAGEDLVQWSLSHEDYTAFRESRPRIEDRPETIDFVRIEGASRTSPGHLRGRLGIVAGDALMAETLERGLNRVFAMDLYQGVDYSLVREDGADGLLVKVTEKPWGPGLMRFGLAFGNDLERGRSGLTVLATHRQTQLNGRGGELLAELRLGEAQGAEIELFQPLDVGGRFFIAPRLDYQEESLEVAVVGAGEVSRGIRETNAAIVLGAQWGDWGELRVELVRGRVEQRAADETTERSLDADVGAVLARLSVDLLDDASFPTSGTWGHVEAFRSARSLGADPTYTRVEGAWLTALSKGRTTTVLEGRFGTAFGSDLPVHHDFALGGFQQLSGLRPRQLVGSRYALGRATFRRNLATLNTTPEGGNLHVGFSLETGNAWSDADDGGLAELRGGASVFVGLETLLGPVFLASGRATSGSDTLYLFVGRSF